MREKMAHKTTSMKIRGFDLDIKSVAEDGTFTGYGSVFNVIDSYNETSGIRTLEEVELVECSIVTVPANDDARINTIKAHIAHGNLPNLPDFEKLLREAGFSNTQAAVIASRGLKHLLRSESDNNTSKFLWLIFLLISFEIRPALFFHSQVMVSLCGRRVPDQ